MATESGFRSCNGLIASASVLSSPAVAIAVGMITILALSLPARSTNALIASSLPRPPARTIGPGKPAGSMGGASAAGARVAMPRSKRQVRRMVMMGFPMGQT